MRKKFRDPKRSRSFQPEQDPKIMKQILLTSLLSVGLAMSAQAQDAAQPASSGIEVQDAAPMPEVIYTISVSRVFPLEDGTTVTRFVPIAEDHVVPGDVVENKITVRNTGEGVLDRFALQFTPPAMMDIDFESLEGLDGAAFVLPHARDGETAPEWLPMFIHQDDGIIPSIPGEQIESIRITLGDIASGETRALSYLARLR